MFNARSICNKLAELNHLILSETFDIVFIVESWLSPSIPDSLLVNGAPYNVFRKDRLSSHGGGLCILAKRNLKIVIKWTESNNLKLNGNKTKELIVYRPGPKTNRISPPPTPGIERVSTLNVLGVILDETLTFRQHIEQRVVHSAASSMYALKVLRSRGLSGQQLWDVTTQTLVARMLYASPVWWGFIDAGSRNEIEAVIRRLIRLNYLPTEFGLFEEMCRKADTALFSAVLNDSTHVLNHLLPPVKDVEYNLRPRTHDRCLPSRLSSLQRKNFFNRLLFLDSY